MKLKEGIGIGVGILFAIVVPVISLGILSKDDQKGRTVPVLEYSWKEATFEEKLVQDSLKDLQVKGIKGFLYQKDSQTPMYFAVFIGKSEKGADAVKAYFKNSKAYPAEFKAREESAMKKLGNQNPVIHSGKSKGDLEITYCGDYVIVSYPPQATNMVLDPLQQEHFIHRYFSKKTEK